MSDIQLHYIEQGQGQPLILLHGNGEDCSYFEHQIGPFSEKYRVIALDTRGHGKSPRGEKPFTIKQFAEDLKDFMDEKGLAKAILLGFSDGGNIALTFALKYPERVEKLILDGANLFPSGVKPLYQWPIEMGYHIAKLFANRDEKAKKNAEMLGLMVNEPHIEPSELARLTMPVLVVAGTNDMIKESHTRLIYNSLPNAQLAILKGNHFVANKHPEAFNAMVRVFLSGYSIRHATMDDLSTILNLRDQAREIMRSYGNTFQWPDGYPRDDMFKKDIELGGSYVMADEMGAIVGSFALLPSPEVTYNVIYDGQWLDNQPYHVIHRIASTPNSHGILDAVLDFSESQVSNIRIDTHKANIIMRKGLEKHGYQYCGIIHLLDGNERLAFQKICSK
jgi:pimeloyl-ACP methyl ester carboxylesterase